MLATRCNLLPDGAEQLRESAVSLRVGRREFLDHRQIKR